MTEREREAYRNGYSSGVTGVLPTRYKYLGAAERQAFMRGQERGIRDSYVLARDDANSELLQGGIFVLVALACAALIAVSLWIAL